VISVDSNGVAEVHPAIVKAGETSPHFGNPFADVVSVDIVGHHPYFLEAPTVDSYQPGDIVEVTLRVPEQFFTETYNRADWEAAVAGTAGMSVGDLTEIFRDNVEIDKQLYGPDGHEIGEWW
jgi:hypothetical protein